MYEGLSFHHDLTYLKALRITSRVDLLQLGLKARRAARTPPPQHAPSPPPRAHAAPADRVRLRARVRVRWSVGAGRRRGAQLRSALLAAHSGLPAPVHPPRLHGRLRGHQSVPALPARVRCARSLLRTAPVAVAAWLAFLKQPDDGSGAVGGVIVASLLGGAGAVGLLLLRLRMLNAKPFVVTHPDGTVSIRKTFYM
jgi:hypothetical protein